ncbi:hypothetical protein [Streptomyces sp. TRM68367]|uniref:hypothetical protein n=1 Tax=Streptomyces sp. TRM68367 TaxID=2758415 RepID=UPI00165A5007|nr:hypothetical protein [Streptomyces sp. TRM68367]MBC9728765.1 hypothetical protein [Streptomyces sp. TRM68367]
MLLPALTAPTASPSRAPPSSAPASPTHTPQPLADLRGRDRLSALAVPGPTRAAAFGTSSPTAPSAARSPSPGKPCGTCPAMGHGIHRLGLLLFVLGSWTEVSAFSGRCHGCWWWR